MPDREKVIKECELLKDFLGDGLPGKRVVFNSYINIVNDAIALLKEYENLEKRHEILVNHADTMLAMLKEQEQEAKWIYGEDETGVDGWHCSECNFFEPWFYEFTDDIDFIRFYKHCPDCGRKMTSYTGKPTKDCR